MRAPLVLALMAASLTTLAYASSEIKQGKFKITTFDVPGTPSGYGILGVENINDEGVIVGYDETSPEVGFVRQPNGKITELIDPLSNGAFQLTSADGLNDEGTVVGYYFDGAHAQYSGFLYRKGEFTTYNFPGLPQYSATTIAAINNLGSFVGYYEAAPAYKAVAYVNTGGKIDTNFVIPTSTFTEPTAIDDFGQVAGVFEDSSSVDHGFFRDWKGKITIIDVPGSASPGTVILGLNDFGWMSGHFWDAENHEHGFLRSPEGVFYQIDVPGANTTTQYFGTAGGGLNNFGVVAGHYDPSNGAVEKGYIAVPEFNTISWF